MAWTTQYGLAKGPLDDPYMGRQRLAWDNPHLQGLPDPTLGPIASLKTIQIWVSKIEAMPTL